MASWTNISSRTKLFLLLYGSIFLIFGSVYIVHLVRVGLAAAEISSKEHAEASALEQEIKALKISFEQEFPAQKFVFTDLLNSEIRTYNRDTVIETLVYWNTLYIKSPKIDFLICLKGRAESEARELRAHAKFAEYVKVLRLQYGGIVDHWVNHIGRHKFMDSRWDVGCAGFPDKWIAFELNEDAVKDFEQFLVEYQKTKDQVAREGHNIDERYAQELEKIGEELTAQERLQLKRQLSETPALKDGSQTFRFESDALGSFDYSIPTPIIDELVLQDAVDLILNEHYKENSLENGSMPYGYCYGKKNVGPSSIEINAGNSDVIVLVKNESDRVIGHVYVQANRSYTLNMPNGVYRVNFYYGKGWNPRKKMKQVYCGNIVGGFIYYETLDKDPERVYLFNQGISYTLRTQQGGNFNTVPSSVGEAF